MPRTPSPEPLAAGNPASVDVVCRQPSNGFSALGMAVDLLYRRDPFSQYKFGPLVSVLRGQILRGHYLLAFRGEQAVGYSGWAECTTDIAQRWLRDGYMPTHDECKGGDCAILINVVSSETATTFALIRAMRLRYPNRPVYFKREYAKGKSRKVVTFNRVAGGATTASGG
jgi:hemolysin-activating ACP:hemolysin acyltransferase